MAEENPANRQLGGFANPNFVLINGPFWELSEPRRYIQGQLWLSQFAQILLRFFIETLRPNEPMFRNERPLQQFGILEILKYANFYPLGPYPTINTDRIRSLRNKMTHELMEWNATNDFLRNLLTEINNTLRLLQRIHDSNRNFENLHAELGALIAQCERELQQMEEHPVLY